MVRALKWWIFLIVGFYLSAILTILPLAESYQWYRPQWIFMLVIFCQILQPNYFNPLVACIIGLLIDCLLGTPLGEYALICAVISYVTSLLRKTFFHRSFWLQVEKIALLVCLGQILVLWFHAVTGQNPHTLLYWMGSVTSSLIWPLFFCLFYFISQLCRVVPYSSRNG